MYSPGAPGLASETRDHCLRSGMDDYIDKPADYQRILQKWLPDYVITPTRQRNPA
jgi:CheY-like chemotaxis protein